MTIHFYLNNEEETQITTMYDMVSNPFKIGDVVNLDIDDLLPCDSNYLTNQEQKNKLKKDNEALRDLFHLKSVKIVKEGKYMRFMITSETKLTIEYHCDLIESNQAIEKQLTK